MEISSRLQRSARWWGAGVFSVLLLLNAGCIGFPFACANQEGVFDWNDFFGRADDRRDAGVASYFWLGPFRLKQIVSAEPGKLPINGSRVPVHFQSHIVYGLRWDHRAAAANGLLAIGIAWVAMRYVRWRTKMHTASRRLGWMWGTSVLTVLLLVNVAWDGVPFLCVQPVSRSATQRHGPASRGASQFAAAADALLAIGLTLGTMRWANRRTS